LEKNTFGRAFDIAREGGFLTIFRHRLTGHEVIRTTDAIAVFIVVEGRGALFVRQTRPAMISDENPEGMIEEVVAGRFDRTLTVRQLVVAEVQEEVGATVAENQVKILNDGEPLATSPGVLTERIYLAYVEVRADQIEQRERIFGKPEEGEKIFRSFIPIDRLDMLDATIGCGDMKTFALTQWFLRQHEHERRTKP
jgi:hypothetical protein